MIEKAKEVLRDLKNCGYEAYVAGGFIRDILNGIAPKDVDVFITGQVDGSVSAKVLQRQHGGRWFRNYGDMDMRDDVHGVLKVDDTLDIIMMESFKPNATLIGPNTYDIYDTVKNFDVSICGCFGKLVGDGLEVYVTDDYLDWKDKGIIYHYTNIMTTQNHLDRIKNKFNVELTPKEMPDSMNFNYLTTL